MPDPQAAQAASIANARCAVHPELTASGVCSRCGDYHCAACQKTISGRSLCATCRALPGIDYLEETRARFWGKRDGFVWYYGVLSVLGQVSTLARGHTPLEPITLITMIVWTAVALAYLALWRPARVALIAVSGLSALNGVARTVIGMRSLAALADRSKPGMEFLTDARTLLILAVGGGAISVLLSLAAYRSPRNKLAFKIEVDERALQRVYDTYVSNSLAMRAAWYSLFGLLPFASLITLGMGIVALRRADRSAWPPRGGRLPATIAIVVSSLWLLTWIVTFSLIKR